MNPLGSSSSARDIVELVQSNDEDQETNEDDGDEIEDDDNIDDPPEDQDKFAETSPDKNFARFNEELGRGAQKTVYRGWDNDEGREVAWNVIKQQERSKETLSRISNEINILQTLEHPNIINLLGAWLDEKTHDIIFITEICQGGSVKKHIKRFKTLRKKIVKKWCKGILEGLDFQHNRSPPIIHRDIKCDNIFINSNGGDIILGDFGLAARKFNDNVVSIVGTPEYMAPEIFNEDHSYRPI